MNKLTSKQEKFCHGVVQGLSQADAYRAAYDAGNMKPETVQNKAYQLMSRGDVRARVEELRKPVVDELQYSLKQAMGEAALAFEMAREKENGGAMVAAVTLRAKLNGLLVEKKEIRTGGLLDDLSHEELKSLEGLLRALLVEHDKAGAPVRITH